MRGEQFRATSGGGDLVGYSVGRGPRVLVLHGGPGLSVNYLEGLVEELSAHFEVAVFQQRGLAPSTEVGPFTVERAVADVAAVLDQLGWEHALLVGHSWGGHLALHVAVSRPHRLAGVAALDPLGAADDGGLAAFNEALVGRVAPEARARVEELIALPDDDASEADHLELMGLVWPGYFATPTAAPPMPSMQIGTQASAGLWADLLARMPQLAAALPEVQVPMTLIGCAGSPVPVEAVQRTAHLVPDAAFEVFEGAGHFPWLERPGLVVAAVDRLARRSAAT